MPTALQSRVVDLIFAGSVGRGVEDAAAIAMAASQPIFASPNPASNTPQTADVQMSRHGRIDQQGSVTAAQSRVWDAAALVFGWQVWKNPAQIDADRRRARRMRV